MHQRNLFLRITRRDGYNRGTDIRSTIMRTQTSSEETVAIGHLEDIILTSAIGRKGTRNCFRPHGKVFSGIKHHNRLTSCSAGSMDTYNLTHWHSSQSERIVVAQVKFIGKRQFYNIINTLDIARFQTHFLELLTVKRCVIIHILRHFYQTATLYLAKLLAIHTFNGFIPNHRLFI